MRAAEPKTVRVADELLTANSDAMPGSTVFGTSVRAQVWRMGISTRRYLFLNDGSLKRVPQRIAADLPFGQGAIRDFVNTCSAASRSFSTHSDER